MKITNNKFYNLNIIHPYNNNLLNAIILNIYKLLYLIKV